MRRRLLSCLFLLLPLPAIAAPEGELAARLLADTGTVAVLAHPRVRAALGDPQPFLGDVGLPRRQRLLEEAGFRAWVGPRVWVLEAGREGEAETWLPPSAALAPRAAARGYRLVGATPLPAAVEAIGFLRPGQPSTGLPALLAAYDADVLVLRRGSDWSLWAAGLALQGTLPAGSDLLPELVAELLAARQQWPEAEGRSVLQVDGVSDIGGAVGVRGVLAALPALQSPRLIRADADTLWFAMEVPAGEAAGQLEAEPRLPASGGPSRGLPLPPASVQAGRLVSPLLLRQWKPEAAPPPPAEIPALQSPPV